MSSTLGTCNSRAGTFAREHALRHPDAVFWRLERLCETGSITRTTHVNAGRPRTARTPAIEDAAAVEREP
jgi:hypothetical protein